MTEPTNKSTEPVEEAEEVVEEQLPAEPAEDKEVEPASDEPASPEADIDAEEELFTDIKEVPKSLQPIAKKMQASFTTKMQGLSEREKTITDKESRIKDVFSGTEDDPQMTEMQEFLYQNPQGQALRTLLLKDLAQSYGLDSLIEDNFQSRAEREINAVVNEFGKDQIEAHIDEIDALMTENKNVPLRYLVSSVLYGKAKDTGRTEVRQKLQEKKEGSLPISGTPNATPSKEVKTFREAFEAADSQN